MATRERNGVYVLAATACLPGKGGGGGGGGLCSSTGLERSAPLVGGKSQQGVPCPVSAFTGSSDSPYPPTHPPVECLQLHGKIKDSSTRQGGRDRAKLGGAVYSGVG